MNLAAIICYPLNMDDGFHLCELGLCPGGRVAHLRDGTVVTDCMSPFRAKLFHWVEFEKPRVPGIIVDLVDFDLAHDFLGVKLNATGGFVTVLEPPFTLRKRAKKMEDCKVYKLDQVKTVKVLQDKDMQLQLFRWIDSLDGMQGP